MVGDRRPSLSISTRITGSSSIPEVVEFLKSSFQPKDFRLGVEVLIGRENALRMQIHDLTKKLEASERRFVELDARCSSLEKTVAATVGLDAPNVISTLSDIAANLGDGLGTEVDWFSFGIQNHPNNGPNKQEPSLVVLSDDEDEVPIHTVKVLGKNEMGSCPRINEENGERSQRKRSINNDDGDISSPRDQKLKCTRELVIETEGDMLKALKHDTEICMSAVCALYRKLLSASISLKPVATGFDPNDEIGVALAKYLIDGHPENKLNRSISEASQTCITESKRLALHYSSQLFCIYSSGEDPFFFPKSISSKL